MATIKVKFRKSTVAGKPGSIYYQLCHEGKVKQLSTNIHLCPEYWDTKAENIIKLSSAAQRQSVAQRISFQNRQRFVETETYHWRA